MARRLPALLRRYEPATRAAIIRSSISDTTLLEMMPEDDVRAMLISSARRLGLTGFVADGTLGAMAGLIGDESVHRQYWVSREWTPPLRNLFAETLTDGGTYIDVGANIGLTVIPMARLPGVRCIALEPEPTNYSFLRANAALNAVDSLIEFHNVAAMAVDGELVMSVSPWNSGDNRVEASADHWHEPPPESIAGKALVRVRGISLDTLLKPETLEGPVVCKIDTQGAEVEVLRGARLTLRQVDLLAIEFWPFALRRLGGDAASLIALLREADFARGLVTKLDGGNARNIDVVADVKAAFAEALALAESASEGDYWDLILKR